MYFEFIEVITGKLNKSNENYMIFFSIFCFSNLLFCFEEESEKETKNKRIQLLTIFYIIGRLKITVGYLFYG